MASFVLRSGPCYACDNAAVGAALHNGTTKRACARHRDPSIKVVHACRFCDGIASRGAVQLGDGEYAHQRCLKEQSE